MCPVALLITCSNKTKGYFSCIGNDIYIYYSLRTMERFLIHISTRFLVIDKNLYVLSYNNI